VIHLNALRYRLIHIHRCRGITRRTIHKFLTLDPTLRDIYTLSPTQLSQRFLISMKHAQLFISDLHCEDRKTQLKKDLYTYDLMTIVDSDYPSVLKRINDPPLVLYMAGDRQLLQHTPVLSVIGTRHPSSEAIQKMNYILPPLLNDNWLIVSGMAKGIDSYAHQITLRNKRYTIAVLGGGFHHIYPRQNNPLFKQITEQGLVISEYPPHIPPKRYHFPERNRIISGLSFGTLVIEATERSGTLITVDQALDQGREVYAVPGSPLIPQTKGCHQMIQDGAKLVINADDIREDWKSIGRHLFYLSDHS